MEEEAALLAGLKPDLVLTDVAYLPLATGAAQAGIPTSLSDIARLTLGRSVRAHFVAKHGRRKSA